MRMIERNSKENFKTEKESLEKMSKNVEIGLRRCEMPENKSEKRADAPTRGAVCHQN